MGHESIYSLAYSSFAGRLKTGPFPRSCQGNPAPRTVSFSMASFPAVTPFGAHYINDVTEDGSGPDC